MMDPIAVVIPQDMYSYVHACDGGVDLNLDLSIDGDQDDPYSQSSYYGNEETLASALGGQVADLPPPTEYSTEYQDPTAGGDHFENAADAEVQEIAPVADFNSPAESGDCHIYYTEDGLPYIWDAAQNAHVYVEIDAENVAEASVDASQGAELYQTEALTSDDYTHVAPAEEYSDAQFVSETSEETLIPYEEGAEAGEPEATTNADAERQRDLDAAFFGNEPAPQNLHQGTSDEPQAFEMTEGQYLTEGYHETVQAYVDPSSQESAYEGETVAYGGEAVAQEAETVAYEGETVTYEGETVAYEGETVTYEGESVAYQGETVAYEGETVAYEGETVAYEGETAAYEGETVAYEGETVAYEGETVAYEGETVAYEGETAAYEGETVSYEGETVAYEGETVAYEGETVAYEGETVAYEGETVAYESETVAYEGEAVTYEGDSAACAEALTEDGYSYDPATYPSDANAQEIASQEYGAQEYEVYDMGTSEACESGTAPAFEVEVSQTCEGDATAAYDVPQAYDGEVHQEHNYESSLSYEEGAPQGEYLDENQQQYFDQSDPAAYDQQLYYPESDATVSDASAYAQQTDAAYPDAGAVEYYEEASEHAQNVDIAGQEPCETVFPQTDYVEGQEYYENQAVTADGVTYHYSNETAVDPNQQELPYEETELTQYDAGVPADDSVVPHAIADDSAIAGSAEYYAQYGSYETANPEAYVEYPVEDEAIVSETQEETLAGAVDYQTEGVAQTPYSDETYAQCDQDYSAETANENSELLDESQSASEAQYTAEYQEVFQEQVDPTHYEGQPSEVYPETLVQNYDDQHLQSTEQYTQTNEEQYLEHYAQEQTQQYSQDQYAAVDAHEYAEGNGAQYLGGDGAQYSEGECAQYTEGDAARYLEGDGAQYSEGDGAQYLEGEGAQYPEGEGAQYLEGEGAQYPEGDGAQYSEVEGAQYSEGDSAQYSEGDGAQYSEGGGAHHLEGEGAQYSEGDDAQYLGGDAVQYSAGDSTQYLEGNGAQYSEGNDAQYPGGDAVQYSEGDGAQYSEGDGAQYPEGALVQFSEGNEGEYSEGDGVQYPGGDGAQYSEEQLNAERYLAEEQLGQDYTAGEYSAEEALIYNAQNFQENVSLECTEEYAQAYAPQDPQEYGTQAHADVENAPQQNGVRHPEDCAELSAAQTGSEHETTKTAVTSNIVRAKRFTREMDNTERFKNFRIEYERSPAFDALGYSLKFLGVRRGFLCTIRPDGVVCIQLKGDQLDKWQDTEFEYDASKPAEKIEVGKMYIIAHTFNGNDYMERCRVKEVENDEALIHLLDTGCEQKIPTSQLYDIINLEEVERLPPQVIEIFVVGLTNEGYSKEELEELEKEWYPYEEVFIIPVDAPKDGLLRAIISRKTGETLGIRAPPQNLNRPI